MAELQRLVFAWATEQSALVGLVVFGVGFLYAFFAFRMTRFLGVVTMSAIGCAGGFFAAHYVDYGAGPALIAAPVLCGLLGFGAPRFAMVVTAGAVLGLAGAYLGVQFRLPATAILVTAGIFGLAGIVFCVLSPRALGLTTNALLGSALLLLGFAGVAGALVPSMGATFKGWAESRSLFMPILMTMVTAMAYSIQASQMQGDICTGK